MPRLRRIAGWVVASVTASGFVWADTSVHGIGSVSLGYTDNMLGAPSHPAPGQPGPVKATFVELAPGVTLFQETPRTLHRFTYTLPITLYIGHSEANSYAHVGNWNGLFAVSPRDELTLGASVARSEVNLANLHMPASQGVVTVQPPGGSTLLTLNASEGYRRELNSEWYALQSTSWGTVIPIDTPGPQATNHVIDVG